MHTRRERKSEKAYLSVKVKMSRLKKLQTKVRHSRQAVKIAKQRNLARFTSPYSGLASWLGEA